MYYCKNIKYDPKIYPLELYPGPTIPPAWPCRLWPSDDDDDDDGDGDDDDDDNDAHKVFTNSEKRSAGEVLEVKRCNYSQNRA